VRPRLPRTSFEATRDRTRISASRNQRLASWATGRTQTQHIDSIIKFKQFRRNISHSSVPKILRETSNHVYNGPTPLFPASNVHFLKNLNLHLFIHSFLITVLSLIYEKLKVTICTYLKT
jgi:hypothetical protein